MEVALSRVAYPARVSFKYDPFGRRIYKSSSSATSVYAYDGDNLVEETNSAGGVVARYEQNQNIDEPLAMLRSSATSYFHADGLGSVTSLSNSAGSIANTYAYDSYGNLTASTGSLVNSFRYTGREFDSETNLYYYRARYYDPTTGRFLSEDPLQLVFSDSQYQYAAANPITRNDPLGLWPEIWQLPGYFWKTYNWVSGTNTAAEMTSDFITGNGNYPRDFGPDSVQVGSLKNSVGVNKARNYYRTHGCDSSGNPAARTGGHKFGLKGLAESGFDPTLQFIGSYDWKISPNSDGTVTFTISNDTSLTSLLYQAGVPSHQRGSFGPFGTITQTYHWTEPGLGCGCKN